MKNDLDCVVSLDDTHLFALIAHFAVDWASPVRSLTATGHFFTSIKMLLLLLLLLLLLFVLFLFGELLLFVCGFIFIWLFCLLDVFIQK